MKSAPFLLILVLSITLVALASIMVKSTVAQDPVIVGKWDRTDGADKYTIYANHVTETVLPDGTYHGTWEYEGTSGYKYVFHWEHSPPGKAPFIDYVTVAADGRSYSGVNNYGDHFNCVRVGSVPAADSGFPILPVAAGGGIAAAAGISAALYWHRRVSLSSRGGKLRASSGKADSSKSDFTKVYNDYMKNNPKRAPFVKLAETNKLSLENPDGKPPIFELNPPPDHAGETPIFKSNPPPKSIMGNVNTGWGDSVQAVPTELDPSAPLKLEGYKPQIKVPRSTPPKPSQSGQTQTSGESTGSATGSESSESGPNSD